MMQSQKFLIENAREVQKNQIRQRIKQLPASFKSQGMIIFIFEGIGTFFLAYGVCATQYLVSTMIPNIYWTFFVSCYLYLGIAAAAPFTGGHVNPAVTVGLTWSGLCESRKVLTYIFSQIVGAFVGVFIYYNCFGHSAEIYSLQPTRSDIILDGIAQLFGTFLFVFGIIYTCKRNYMKGEYFKYFFIVLMLLVGRTYTQSQIHRFTFRQGVLNPAVAFAFQLIASINNQNSMLLFDIWGIVIGQIIGGLLASYFYQNFYQPLLDQVQKIKSSQ